MRALTFSFLTLFFVGTTQAQTMTEALTLQLAQGPGAATEEDTTLLASIEPFYQDRAMLPIFVGDGGVNEKGRQLTELLSQAAKDGLDPGDYGLSKILELASTGEMSQLAELEMRLSLGLVKFASDLGEGRTSPQIADPKLYPFRDRVDATKVLAMAAEDGDMAKLLAEYRPKTVRYARVQQALHDYRALAEKGGWPTIPSGPTLTPGMTDPRIAMLREWLRIAGDLSDDADQSLAGGDPELYDPDMEDAVRRMQYRHGLDQDGAVGKATLRELNVSVEARIQQLTINLERRRWMRDDFGQRYIFVNLANFDLKLVDEPKTILDMRVVVGKTYHKTPVFSKEMTHIVINPYWNVPPSIARNEILPQIKKDPGYLARKNFTLFDGWGGNAGIVDPYSVDWSQYSGRFPYRLRQEPGQGNALGRIKFMLPNHFNIYLHDTPAKSGFRQTVRSFSHGCVRVHEPRILAEYVLANNPGWDRARIDRTIASGKRKIVVLKEPLPVHISYLTAWVNKDGSVHFRGDIYKRDGALARTLFGQRAG